MQVIDKEQYGIYCFVRDLRIMTKLINIYQLIYKLKQHQMQFKVPAGQFTFDKQTHKAKVCKDKGCIQIIRNEEMETHFKWINTETNSQELDLIVFAGDAVFERVTGQNNTFVLRFGMDEQRYFFWLQGKADPQTAITQINKIINFQEEQELNEMVGENSEKSQFHDQQNQPSKVQTSADKANPDFIRKLVEALKKNQPAQHVGVTHLCEVVTPELLLKAVQQFSESQISELVAFMPEEQKQAQYISGNIRSPQFLQALDALSDAFNSQNAFPLFIEMGLDQTYLQRHYGVQAFLRALISKNKQSKEQGQ